MCDGLLMPVYYTDDGVVPIEREREKERKMKNPKTRQSRSSSTRLIKTPFPVQSSTISHPKTSNPMQRSVLY